MPSVQSGRVFKSRKGKTKGTPHQRNHRWESFTTKISKLHALDPLRRVRRHDLETEDLDATTSYLRTGLETWAELNLSKAFTSFKRELQPLCDSLPQILHFEGRIMDMLEKYISQQDAESLEPLLDLLTAFAHDLGMRFEKHYPRALALIIQIASRPQDAAVVEWTFACLAFLFKYLSKLLVPNLQPTYDLLAPLLGKARNPAHVAKFAAEALSFLVKKAAAPASRDKALTSFIEHVRDDFAASRDNRHLELYYHGLMTMFAEAVKGQGHGIHTAGPDIVKALILSVPNDQCVSPEPINWSEVVCGVLISLVHHTNSETFLPIPQAITDAIQSDDTRAEFPLRNIFYLRCLGTISGVRKGNRIVEWRLILGSLLQCLELISKHARILETVESTVIWQQLLVNIAIVWHQAPMDILIPHITEFTAVMTREPLMGWFIPFCSYFSDLDSTRFRSLFLKPFQKFIVQHWSQGSNQDMLCVFLPRMMESRALPFVGDADSFSLPQSWQDQIVSKFERLEISPFPEQGASGAYNKDPKTWRDRCLPKYSALLRLLELTTVRPSTIGPIADVLLRKLKLALRPSQSPLTEEARFIVSQGFSAYLKMSKVSGQLDSSLAPLLKAATPRYYRLTGFLEAMLEYETMNNNGEDRSPPSQSEESHEGELDPFLQCLVQSLSMPSHDHRLASLHLLHKIDSAPDELDCLALMLQAEQTPVDLQNARVLSMHTRNLAVAYPNLRENSWLRHAIPYFLFGLMTVQMTPIWDSVVETLKQISETKSGDSVICDLAFRWIDIPSKRWEGSSKGTAVAQRFGQTDFECTNLARLHSQAEDADHTINNAPDVILDLFEKGQEMIPEIPLNARSQALKVFSASPALAERRSRRLVPLFLSWSLNSEEEDPQEEEGDEDTDRSWSLFDKKTFIAVISQFSNPKVLFQSRQVYDALLVLLSNGDIDIQKSALKGILNWKQEGVKPYQENLEYLLDEARFKNELTVLFQGDKQIQPEHRSEVMPVLLRLLYGRTISKKGIASGRHGLQANRLAVLRQLSVEDMGSFLDISLGNMRNIQLIGESGFCDDAFERDLIPARKQVGFLNMMEGVINELGTSVADYIDRILPAIISYLVPACRKLQKSTDATEEDSGEAPAQTSLLRTVRSTSLKCVVSLLQNAPGFDWTPYRGILVKEAVSPRLDKLAIENAQGISGILQLLSTFSKFPSIALFFNVDNRIIGKLMDLVAFAKSKDHVRIFSLRIVRDLVKLSQLPAAECESKDLIAEELIEPNVNLILETVGRVLKNEENIGKDLLLACVEAVVELSPMVRQSHYVETLINVAIFLLDQPSKTISPKTKSVILLMLERFLALEEMAYEPNLLDRIYSTIASLYSFFRDRPSRETLSDILAGLLRRENKTSDLPELCANINAFRKNRIDEPDYDKRLAAFNAISKPRDTPFTLRDWEPLIHNMIFYIKHDEEYGVLSANSADGLCSFIDAVASSTQEGEGGFHALLSTVVLPSLYMNAKEPSETVRRETVRVIGYLVSRMPSWGPISDLVALNPVPDEKDPDPSFFSNILNPAALRQMRALQLLSKGSVHATLSSRHTAHFFVPLLEHFIFNRSDSGDDRGVGAQAATTISELAFALEWPQYRAILRRYIGYVETKPGAQKQLIRLLGKFVDTLTSASIEKTFEKMDLDNSMNRKSHLSSTLPSLEKFNEDVLSTILPPLLNYMHEKDESTVSSRVPVGIIIVKTLKLLPEESLNQKLPGVLTDICHILKSKALESREMARDTLSKMTSLLGPSYLGFVLKELRGALTAGYQLHVLSYTMHTILVAGIPQLKPGDIDYCLDDIMTIIMDDIFGVIGQEKDADGYTNKTKEVKSSKSQDSMELIARTASVNRLGDLISPLRSLLLEKVDLRMVRRIDELLSRITAGLLGNPAAASRDTLIFCYEVVQQVYASQKGEAEPSLDPKIRRYLIQKGAKRSGERSTTSQYTYKLVRFAIDVLRAILKKHDNLRNSSNITGFIPILGDAAIAGEEEVKVATFKLLNVLTKVPFKTDDASKLYKVVAKEATKCISTSPSFSGDLAQASLKLMAVIIRDRRDVVVKDAAVDMLLGKLKDDLTEPLYRHITFNFLRSVLDQKIETATVYDTLDYVGTVMITNDDKNTRDLARGAFFQFLRDYPQKKNRWAKQLSFIVANLKYDREGGRLSVMEVIHLLLVKSADDFVQEVAANCFIPLILVLANDDSEKCSLAAAELIREIFRKSDKERTSKFLGLARGWLEQEDNASVLQLAIRSFALYFEAREPSPKDQKDLDRLLSAMVTVFNNFSTWAQEIDLIKVILQTLPILISKHPATVLAHDELWRLTATPLSHSDALIKAFATQLVITYLTDFHENNKNVDRTQRIVGSYGLELDRTRIERLITGAVGTLSSNVIARWKKRQGRKPDSNDLSVINDEIPALHGPMDLDEALAADASRIILMLSKYLDAGTRDMKEESAEVNSDEDNTEEADEDEGAWEGLDSDDEIASEQQISLYNVCTWLSDILVEETRPRAAALVPKVAALDIVSILVGTSGADKLQPSLHTILIPLHQLTDPSIPVPSTADEEFKTRHEALRAKATETMDALQRKFGTATYTAELLAVRERARRRREGRSRKRKIEAVVQPERFGQWKRGRLEKKIKSRKEKGAQNRNRRHQY
ncbi:putative U3 small nucleolar RNA-associated protein 20 [Rosellinia necatrix]|uniref:Putative U3 small nucleolar RNA-associated protein 20 n=1 Tax=Rosellinia necatrix TaxID=77044 RepID=A0A1W2TTV3_ROSNE|nr:putative U3 small nucleolar RNA-associated protein 20 [Rosellinia necatrix]